MFEHIQVMERTLLHFSLVFNISAFYQLFLRNLPQTCCEYLREGREHAWLWTGLFQNALVFSMKIVSLSFWFLLTARCVSFSLSAALFCGGRTWWACSLSLYWKTKSSSKEGREHWAYSCKHLMACKKKKAIFNKSRAPDSDG